MRPRSRANSGRWGGWGAALIGTLVLVAPLTAQNNLTGTVVDGTTQQPLSGAQVVVEGTELGALTDNRGRFLILNAPSASATIEVIMIGYRAATIQITANQPVTVELTATAISLDEIVVTGVVGEQQARSIGNAIGKVDAAQLEELAPSANVQAMMSANVPGVRIMDTGGAIGEGGIIRIRGANSMTLAGTPIIVVDGIRVDNQDGDRGLMQGVGTDSQDAPSRLNDFNPDEIESIEVIKGPAAATLYGTEASNGVIQIITKRGAQGAPRVNVQVKQGANWLPNPVELVPPTFYRNSAGEIVEVNVLELDQQDAFGALDGGRDWFRTGHNQGYQADVSGGSESVTYFVSADWERDEGPVPYNWQNSLRGRANLTYAANEDLRFDFSLGNVRTKLESPSAQQPLLTAVIWSCPAPGCEPGSGSPQALDGPSRGYIAYLPEAYEDEIEGFQDLDRTTFSLVGNHQPTDWLSQRVTVGGDFSTRTNTELYLATGNLGNFFNTGRKIQATSRNTFVTLDYQASADFAPSDGINFQTAAGLQFYKRRAEVLRGQGDVFALASLETISAGATRIAEEQFLENKTFGLFVQEQVSLGDRLFLTGAVRGDDNSAFGQNFDFVVYPKFSASYVISDEQFFQDGIDFVNQLKLRGAWGKAGRQPDVFDALRTYQPAVGPGGQATITPENLGNPDLKPEVGQEIELGFDAALWNDRIGVEFTWYDQTTKDAIVSVPAIPSLGFPGVQFRNIGETKNDGIEIGINAQVFQSDNVSVDLGATYATTNNEVTDLGGQPPIIQWASGGQYHVEGFSLGSIFLPRVVSSEIVDGNATNAMCEGGDVIPGSPNLSRGGGAPVPCAGAPSVFWGQPIPDTEGSLYTTITLGQNLQIYGLVDYVDGITLISGDIAAQHRFFLNSRAILERTDPVLLGYETLGGIGLWQPGVIDGGFAKLRVVSATYTLPGSFASRIGASRVNVTAAINNPWTIWVAQSEGFGVRQMDPEVANQTGPGTDGLNAYNQEGWPQMKSFSFNVRVTF